MFTVLKSFATKELTGTKGKPIEISDKKLAGQLKKVGYIADLSKKDLSSAEKDKEIAGLKDTINSLNTKVSELESENQNLLNKIEELSNSDINDDENKNDGENATPSAENNDGDDKNATPPVENKDKSDNK